MWHSYSCRPVRFTVVWLSCYCRVTVVWLSCAGVFVGYRAKSASHADSCCYRCLSCCVWRGLNIVTEKSAIVTDRFTVVRLSGWSAKFHDISWKNKGCTIFPRWFVEKTRYKTVVWSSWYIRVAFVWHSCDSCRYRWIRPIKAPSRITRIWCYHHTITNRT